MGICPRQMLPSTVSATHNQPLLLCVTFELDYSMPLALSYQTLALFSTEPQRWPCPCRGSVCPDAEVKTKPTRCLVLDLHLCSPVKYTLQTLCGSSNSSPLQGPSHSTHAWNALHPATCTTLTQFSSLGLPQSVHNLRL